ncbi:MAG: hypothetical protein NTV00_00205 [Methylococcales bacterium]|nr:hypothetical protein [Methylococcales bacterium]
MPRLLNHSIGLVMLLYPLAVYFGIQVLAPWKISAALLVILAIRFYLSPIDKQWSKPLIGIGILYCAFAIWHNSELSLRLYPVGVNLCLFLLFSLSLLYPPPVIERLARLQHPELSLQGVSYTRKVTQVWCVFFIINASIAAGTALWANFFWWSLYNGLIAYVLIGLLIGIEYLIRIKMQKNEQ